MRLAPALELTIALAAATVGTAQPTRTVIDHVGVVDVDAGSIRSDQRVVLAGGRIEAVGSAAAVPLPPNAAVVDGRGRFLMPGLWDMHVHLSIPGGEPLLGFYPLVGVTGVRDMNDSFPEVLAWRDRIARGTLIGPRIVAAGPYLVGISPPLPHLLVKTAADGRAGVDSLRRLGVDFVKVHNEIPREGYFAIAARVKELGWSFAGHVPRSLTVAEAAAAGQRSIEHLTGFDTICSSEELASFQPTPLITFLLGSCNAEGSTQLIQPLLANHTWITPTLTVLGLFSGAATTPVDSMARYRSEGLRQLQTVVMRLPPLSEDARAAAGLLARKRRALVGELARAGVPILAGSDAPTPGTFPGVSLLEELDELAAAGLTSAEAIRAATVEPARYLAATDSLGSIGPGKVADLVLLEANPLESLRNLRRIVTVWVGGRPLDAEARRRIRTAAEAAARR